MSPAVAMLATILLLLIVPPTWFLIQASFHTTRPDGSFDQFTLRFYQQVFTSPYFASSLWNTVVYAAGTAIVAIALGVVQALIVERTNTPGRNMSSWRRHLLGIPHVLYVVAAAAAWPRWAGERADRNSARRARAGPVLDVYSV
jgi:ABC-type spermidine/putrescine transport system permease subunit II